MHLGLFQQHPLHGVGVPCVSSAEALVSWLAVQVTMGSLLKLVSVQSPGSFPLPILLLLFS